MRELVAKAGGTSRAAHVSDAVAASEIVLLATPWPATKSALEGAGDLTGKILVDAVNPVLPDLSGLEYGHDFGRGDGGPMGARRASSEGIQHCRIPRDGKRRFRFR